MFIRRKALVIALAWTALVLLPACLLHAETEHQPRRYYTVMVGTFKSLDNAVKVYERTLSQMDGDDREYLRIDRIAEMFSVRIGRFDEKEKAEAFLGRVKASHPNARILLSPFDESLHVKIYRGGTSIAFSDAAAPARRPSPAVKAQEQQKSAEQDLSAPAPTTMQPSKQTQPSRASGSAIPVQDQAVVDRGIVRGVITNVSPLSSSVLAILPDRTLYRVVVKIIETEEVPGFANILKERVGQDMTCFSDAAVPRELIGTRVRGFVEYRGDEWSRFFWISEIQTLDGNPSPQ